MAVMIKGTKCQCHGKKECVVVSEKSEIFYFILFLYYIFISSSTKHCCRLSLSATFQIKIRMISRDSTLSPTFRKEDMVI